MASSPIDTEKSSAADTPMLRQYHAVKAKHPDCILLFRLGDFYEMFFQDAEIASKILDVVLTARGKGTASHVPMCGFPHHAADAYISKLIKAGHKVGICEQMEDPASAKGIVKRDLTRVITAGTFLDEHNTEARHLVCLISDQKYVALAFMDPAEGTIQTHILPDQAQVLIEFFSRWKFYEYIVPDKQREEFSALLKEPLLKAQNPQLTILDDWNFNTDISRKNLCAHFGTANLHGFGLEQEPLLTAAASGLLEYVKRMNQQPMRHVDKIQRYNDSDYTVISSAAFRGLELDLLIRAIDMTQTAMGKRLLRFWMLHPLKKIKNIRERQDAVQQLNGRSDISQSLKQLLSQIPDLEKHLSRISSGYTHPKDLLAIRNALTLVPEMKKILGDLSSSNVLIEDPASCENKSFKTLDPSLRWDDSLLTVNDIPDLRTYLEKTINPDCPLSKPEGHIIRANIDAELDRLRDVQNNGHEFLKKHQEEEIKRTGISSLKISFNKIFGYYIEITRANLNLVPSDYIRKQTLVNAERFVTPKLGEYEQIILTAQEKIFTIENKIIREVQQKILDQSQTLHQFCRQVAIVDCLASLSALAQNRNYIFPTVNDGTLIDIRQGRHPVVEKTLVDDFIPNDTLLDDTDNRLVILTGPNMAGKSTYIRQTAILMILSQMGSSIPAESATIGIVDKIFTRIGAHDDITRGQSTFMVEMNETAEILNNLTDRSLVILDEIGRGTSTYDGLSLAWALVEHLHQTKARTLFATHFHELISLAEKHQGIKNYNVAVKEWDDEIIFLHKIIPGGADDSYGIYVAKLAGVSQPVIQRAKEILTKLELKDNAATVNNAPAGAIHESPLQNNRAPQSQMNFYFEDSSSSENKKIFEKIKQQLNQTDLNNTTPMQALKILEDIKKVTGNG